MCFSPQRRAIFRQQNKKCSEDYSFCIFTSKCFRHLFRHQQTKVLQTPHVLHILTCKCAFRHSAVQFFNIRTYQSGPNTSCFVHFHLRMCFSPQARTIFQHQNVPKWSKHVMFCAFSLPNVLFATAACNFSTSERTKVVQTRHVLYIFTCECAFRHRRVQFFNIRTYQSGPNTSCFVHFHFRMCFSPQRRAFF